VTEVGPKRAQKSQLFFVIFGTFWHFLALFFYAMEHEIKIAKIWSIFGTKFDLIYDPYFGPSFDPFELFN